MKKIDDVRASALAAYFYKMAEQSQDVFWIKSQDYTEQIYISPAFETIWGYSCQSLYENPSLWIDAMLPEDRNRLQNDCSSRTGPPDKSDIIEKNYRIQRPDQSIRWIRDISFGLFDADNQCFGFAGTCKDVSKDVLHRQELEEAKQYAEMANQAKSDFLAMMSHELRTPLNAILGMTQIMMRKNLQTEMQEHLSIITMAGNNLLSLVNDVLDFAKLEIGQLSFSSDPIDLYLLCSQVIQSLVHEAKTKNTILSLHYHENNPTLVIGDAKRIRQIFINLISNAIKFTENGHIHVRVNTAAETDTSVAFHVDVEDTGIGIPESKIEYIFGKFNQIESIHQRRQCGAGLGLAITKQLVERIGGAISAKSEVGRGSTFTFTLPLPKQASSAIPSYQVTEFSENAARQILNVNLLLVEDNPINQKIAQLMFEDIGCQVDIAESGHEALEKLVHEHSYQAIFMDIGLPDINGFELAARIRQAAHNQHIPIIAMTAHILESDKQKCFSSGMDDVITKPITYDDLYQSLKAMPMHA